VRYQTFNKIQSLPSKKRQSNYFFRYSGAVVNKHSFRFKQNNSRLLRHDDLMLKMEMDCVIQYFITSLSVRFSVDDILWDLCKNCIAHLGFEDCVIYLVDKERNILVQKAAWGPKTTDENRIINPIEIPMGQGIVGSVAESGRSELVADTTKDSRYIIDDVRRHSDISVPIKLSGKVFGVLDSEHSQKNFYTERHLYILDTVAAVCASKLILAQAEEEKQEAIMNLLRYERTAALAQLRSLRLQMNPHFIFNSLNSIQQLILRNQTEDATRYLSKFSKLLRAVLTYSELSTVTISREIEILELYLQLESLRFKDSFHYTVTCSQLIFGDEMEIPTLLIQPFVENAIWHGLLNKPGERTLQIDFQLLDSGQIVCSIEDNGIGREEARKMKQTIPEDIHTGKGIRSAEERLLLYNQQFDTKSRLVLEDLFNDDGCAAGTKVTIYFPLWNE
jgi:LytS/YehU family sensor histidine kinase